jgi:conjugative relaxase-like TrwC/TraI family protein
VGRNAVPVAGFDLTFSPPKSVSVAWALADEGTKAVIDACHRRAVSRTLSWAEDHVFHSRSGHAGVVEEDVTGVVAASFTHWSSRADDPQLHDHVVIWNRARSVGDGRWRTLDSRAIFKATTTLSELHQGVLTDLLTEALGYGWEARSRRHSPRPRYEIDGVPEALMAEFSTRAAAIAEAHHAQLASFRAAHGRAPSPVEAMRLRQTATLATRGAKSHRSLAELTESWRDRADRPVPRTGQVAWVSSLAARNDLPRLRRDDLAGPILTDAADRALPGRAERLSVDQALAVERIATSGRVLDVLVGPAGTGKSTTMAGLRAVWEEVQGPGSVVGLRRGRSVGSSRVRAGWREERSLEWLVTPARLAGRLPLTGEFLSISWAGVAGLEVDVAGCQARIQTASGWRCVLSGPGVAPIAVAGVAACHGVAAPVEHPGLAGLRDPALPTDPASTGHAEPLALGRGEPELVWPPKPPRR